MIPDLTDVPPSLFIVMERDVRMYSNIQKQLANWKQASTGWYDDDDGDNHDHDHDDDGDDDNHDHDHDDDDHDHDDDDGDDDDDDDGDD